MKNQEQTNLKVVVLLLCSSMGLLSIMLGLTEADGIEAVLYTILGVIFISFIFVFFYFQKKKETKELEKKYLKQLYEYLEKNNYNITAIGFASYSGLPPDKAREVIESVAIKTGISPEIDENGKIHYNFK
jgi:glucose uptake protein GlcU